MLPLLALDGGAKISHQEPIAGLVGPQAHEPGRQMHDRDVKAPSERAKLAGACATGQWPWRDVEGFLACFTVGTATAKAQQPHLTSALLHLTHPRQTIQVVYDIETPASSGSH